MNFNEQLDAMWEKDNYIMQLQEELAEKNKVLQMCFDDSCKESGKLTKKTVIELMKHVNLQA